MAHLEIFFQSLCNGLLSKKKNYFNMQKCHGFCSDGNIYMKSEERLINEYLIQVFKKNNLNK